MDFFGQFRQWLRDLFNIEIRGTAQLGVAGFVVLAAFVLVLVDALR